VRQPLTGVMHFQPVASGGGNQPRSNAATHSAPAVCWLLCCVELLPRACLLKVGPELSIRHRRGDARNKDVRFDKLSFKEWQATGKDHNSIIANPEFANPETFDFMIKNKALMKKIGFKPFDYSLAGVYGSVEWKALAAFDPLFSAKSDDVIRKFEK